MKDLKKIRFLKDVFICSLGAYGGPAAHYGVYLDQLVIKRNYLTEEELIELVALCGLLPGPSSSQTIVSVGYKLGGPRLASLTMAVWSLPVIIIMTILSFLSQIFENYGIDSSIMRLISPMAAGFIIVAAFRIGRKVIKDLMTIILFVFGLISSYFIRAAWVFPLILIIGGFVSIFFSKERDLWERPKLKPKWKILALFAALAIFIPIIYKLTGNYILMLFDKFYRYGYLVFGGGQVLVPLMYTDLVEIGKFMTSDQFLTGYGLVQGLPGPMFSFCAYAAGIAASDGGVLYQIISALVGVVGIFLPGLLLIFFVYPLWQDLRNIKGIKISLKGVNAVAGGMITAAAILILKNSGLSFENLIVLSITIIILITKKIPAPLIVIGVILAGIFI